MHTFIFSAWFRDECLSPTDEDHEWVAVLTIHADSCEVALAWGGRSARKYAVTRGVPFVR